MKDMTFQCWNVAILYSKKDLPCHFHSLSLQSYIWAMRLKRECNLFSISCSMSLPLTIIHTWISFYAEEEVKWHLLSKGWCSTFTFDQSDYNSCVMLKRRWKSIYHLNGGVPAPLSRAWTGWAQRQKITKGGKQAKCNLLPNITVNLRSAIAIVQLSVKARLKNNSVYMSTPRKIFRLLVIEANIIVRNW